MASAKMTRLDSPSPGDPLRVTIHWESTTSRDIEWRLCRPRTALTCDDFRHWLAARRDFGPSDGLPTFHYRLIFTESDDHFLPTEHRPPRRTPTDVIRSDHFSEAMVRLMAVQASHNMVFTLRPCGTPWLSFVQRSQALVQSPRSSGIVRFVQGGVVKTFRCTPSNRVVLFFSSFVLAC